MRTGMVIKDKFASVLFYSILCSYRAEIILIAYVENFAGPLSRVLIDKNFNSVHLKESTMDSNQWYSNEFCLN